MSDTVFLLALLVTVVATYSSRAIGVLLAGRIDPNGVVFKWVGCVAYALLAGLVARMIVLPIGPVAEIPLTLRLLAAAIAIGIFAVTRRSILLGAAGGFAALVLSLFYLR